MAQFNDLRQMSTNAIASYQAGQASRGKETSNRLAEIQVANEPTRIRQQNRLADIKLSDAENAPNRERESARGQLLEQFGQGLAQKMQTAKTPQEQEQIYNTGQQAITQHLMQRGLLTPEEAQQSMRTLEQMGGAEGFIGAFGVAQEPPDPSDPLSGVGKLIADRDRLAAQFGEDSEQVRAINAAIEKSGKSTPLVEISGDKKEKQILAEGRAGRFNTVIDKGMQADEKLQQLTQLESMDIRQGIDAGARNTMARVFNALGANGDALLDTKVSNAQSFNAVSGKLLADALAAQKGPQTDKDAERMKETLPSIQNEALANKFVLQSLKAMEYRNQEMADFYETYLEQNDTTKGVRKAWATFKNRTPLLSDTVKDASTGLPMFYFSFKQQARERNPGATDKQILDAWRSLSGDQ